MKSRLAALALLVSFAAAARGYRRTFQVGAIVVASAAVSSTYDAGGPRHGIEVRLSGHRRFAAAVLVGGEMNVVRGATRVTIAAIGGADEVVTVLY
jgi:hypothetical protein